MGKKNSRPTKKQHVKFCAESGQTSIDQSEDSADYISLYTNKNTVIHLRRLMSFKEPNKIKQKLTQIKPITRLIV